jgi:VWFA-related protein
MPARRWLALAFSAMIVTVAGVAAVQQPTFRARVNLVRLQVLVTDHRRPISGLTANDFEVRDNGVPQDIDAVSEEHRPLDMLLVMDRSQSMAGEPIVRLKAAARETVDALGPDDRCGMVTFSQRIRMDSDLTTRHEDVRQSIDGLEPDGMTSLVDALYGALSMRFEAGRRSVILLFSDGLDNRSWTTAREVIDRARQSETIIGAVAYSPTRSPRGQPSEAAQPDMTFLQSLAADSGGEVVVAERPEQFAAAFSSLLERARSRYLVTYYPKGIERTGWHEVKVTLRNRRGTVVARRGYSVGAGASRD